MRLYNTLTRQKEEFVPREPGKVAMYICGPTVYNHIHIGNARTFLSFDVIRRYLRWSGYEVTYVQNVTDVDDKIINRAREENRTPAEVAAEYTEAFITAMHALGIEDPDVRPKATAEIPAMIEMIECLIENGHAYAVEGDVYFAVRSFEEYGKLSGRDIEQMQSGARVDIDPRKRDPLDFALWKAAKPGEPSWDSPWSQGRPGWHIECSAMSAKYLGNPFDIHAGGDDLVFPHHENEIAQSEACSHTTFANYWLHGGMLTIDREKMSKSEGNFLLLKDVLSHIRPQALRLLMLQTHYRSPFDYSAERLQEATAALERVEGSLRNQEWAIANAIVTADELLSNDQPNKVTDQNDMARALLDHIEKTHRQFKSSMDDDFNTAGAVAAIFELVTAANSSITETVQNSLLKDAVAIARQTIIELLGVLGVALEGDEGHREELPTELVDLAAEMAGYGGDKPAEAVGELLAARQKARERKDWACADALRDGLAELGFAIEDTAAGARVVRKG